MEQELSKPHKTEKLNVGPDILLVLDYLTVDIRLVLCGVPVPCQRHLCCFRLFSMVLKPLFHAWSWIGYDTDTGETSPGGLELRGD